MLGSVKKPAKKARPSTGRITISVRVSRETRDRLSRAMVQTSRNLSDYIELALTDRFQKDGIHWRTLTILKGSSSCSLTKILLLCLPLVWEGTEKLRSRLTPKKLWLIEKKLTPKSGWFSWNAFRNTFAVTMKISPMSSIFGAISRVIEP